MTSFSEAVVGRRAVSALGRRALTAALGVALLTLGAHLAVPLPGTLVPLTFQVAAVLVVGALLGPGVGAASAVTYLLLGVAGLPVFAPVPTSLPGAAALFGPTGGYLLTFPIAAAIAGRAARTQRLLAILGWFALATLAIHVGGVAQLTVLGGSLRAAVVLGSLPFLIGDGLKLLFAGLLVWRFGSKFTRALR